MWTPSATRGSYERADTEDQDVSDALTLAGDDLAEGELVLSAEELAAHDPLDEKNYAQRPLLATSRWTAFVRRWQRRPYEDDVEKARLLTHGGPAPPSRTIAWLLFPLPSWSHRFFGYPMPDEPPRSTDYLDGLRGVASLFVFFDHYLMGGMDDLPSYGFGEGNHWNIMQLPFIRTTFSGAAMVAIFYVISGYVLSVRCIVALRAGKQEKVNTALTSMAFRRAIRLFVPSIAASGVSLVTIILGIQGSASPKHRKVLDELSHYRVYLNDYLLNIWSWEDPIRWFRTPEWHGWYGGQLWTIPVEFNCSMILFVFILATSRCRVRARFTIEALMLAYLFYVGRWDVATFIAGMAIAEIHLITAEHKPSLGFRMISWIALITAWYLSGFPQEDQEHTPGYAFLSATWAIDPMFKWRFWLAISGIILVGSVSFLPTAQRVFTTSTARYLGRISYALYLTHALLNVTLRKVVWNALHVIEHRSETNNALTWNWVIASILYFPCVLWGADIFWRLVDRPAVKFAKWVEAKCFVQEKE